MSTKSFLTLVLIVIVASLTLFPFMTSVYALLIGIFIAVILGNPVIHKTKPLTPYLLQISVIGLGFGMNLLVVGKVGVQGIGYTVAGIMLTFLLGAVLGRTFETARDISTLIAVGTAICGGSAIAAVAPVIKAKSHDISVALVTVFLLNAIALLVFPFVGHYFGFTEIQFGLWSALAIHDTSSVVGATLQYGPQALEVGTTVKLARALWIAPVAFGIGIWRLRNVGSDDANTGSVKIPWFILGFVAAAALVTWIPELQNTGHIIESVAKRTLVLTLFLIGLGISRESIKTVGARPLIMGASLWLIMSILTFVLIQNGIIN